MTSHDSYTTTWSYDAADNGGLDSFVVPLPTSLSGVDAADSSSNAIASSSNSSNYATATHAQLYPLEDGRHVILRVLELGNSFQLQDINTGACITFQLPGSPRTTKIIPECSVSLFKTTKGEVSVQVLVLADLGAGLVAYRLLISDADFQNPADLPVDGRGAARWCTEQQILPSHVISRSSPVLVHALDKRHLAYDTLALAFSDGTLLKLEWIAEEGRFHETALSRQQSFLSSMRSLLPGRFGSHSNLAAIASASPARNTTVTSSHEQVVSMTSLSSTCLYTISRDRKLRIWSAPSNTCLETIQLPQNPTTMEIVPSTSSNEFERENSREPSLLSSDPIPLMRLFSNGNGSSSTQHLLVHVPTSQVQTSFFILYSLTFDDRGRLTSISPVLEKPCDFGMDTPSSSSYLGDFRVLPGQNAEKTLWTLWNENGQTIVRYSKLDLESSSEALVLPDPNDSLASLFPPAHESWHTVSLSPHQTNHSLDIPAAAFDRAYEALRSDLDPANLSTPELAHQVTLCAKEACVDSFVEHLFHPGRYPTSAINAALLTYVRGLSRASPRLRIPSRSDGLSSLAQQLLDVVGSQLTLQEDPMTGALKEDEFIKAYKLEHMKLLALAEENKRNAKQPLALGEAASHELLILAKGAIAAPVDTAWPIAITHDDKAAVRTPLEPGSTAGVAAVYKLALHTMADLRKIDSFALASFEDSATQSVSNPATLAIEDIAAEIFQDVYENLVDEQLQLAFSAQLKQIQQSTAHLIQASGHHSSPAAFATLLLTAINSLTSSSRDEPKKKQAQTSVFGQVGLSGLIVDDSTEDIQGRYAQALALLLVVLFIQHGLAEPPTPSGEGEEDQNVLVSNEESLELLSRALEVFKGFATAKWLANSNTALTDLKFELSDAEENSADDLMLRLQDMRFRGSTSSSEVSARPESLLSTLLDCADDETLAAVSQAQGLKAASQAFLHRLGLLDWEEVSSATLASVVTTLVGQELNAEALSLVSRTPERDEDAALLHVQGLIACRGGDIEGAIASFDKVASAIYTDDASLAILTQVANAADCDTRSAYYRSVVPEFEAQQASLAIATTCLRAIQAYETEEASSMSVDERPSWLKDLWYKAFRNFTSIGAFDEAYTTMMGMPSRALQLDALRHLVAVMCEEGAAGVLLKYAFVGMQDELEKCLSFRARNAYPLAQPDYYKILHAWQCLMNDYRGAAATMYQRAKRLSVMSMEPGLAMDILTAQCQSYLVAINVLELQAPEKRFIMVETDGAQHSQPKRKRMRLMDAKLQDPAMITLEAIKREYTLTLARLQLSRDFPELTGTGQHLDSQGAVALFTQIGAFDLALQAALALGLDMSNIFEHMTLRCIAYSQGILVDSADEAWVVQDSNAASWEGSLASKAWKLLQLYLERYDTEGEYRRKVLSVILQEDRRIRLPKALVDWFMEYHPEFLIWKLVEYDLLEDAYIYAHRMLEQRTAQLQKNVATMRSEAVYIPYNLLDQLLAVDLEDEIAARKDDLQDQQKRLKEAIDQQYRRMDQVLTVL